MITRNFRNQTSRTRQTVRYSQPRPQGRRLGLFVAALTSLAGAAIASDGACTMVVPPGHARGRAGLSRSTVGEFGRSA